MDATVEYWILCLIQALIAMLDFITDMFFGITMSGGSRKDREKAELVYEKSAHIVKIAWRAKHHPHTASKLHNFLCIHEEYVSPKYVLEHRNIMLLAVDREYALFSVLDPQEDLFDSVKHPNIGKALYFHAKKLVVVPIGSFHKLADELGDPKVPITWIAMTGRCGSTLLVQMMNKVPGTRTLGEPIATLNINDLRLLGKIKKDESLRLLKSGIRLMFKTEPDSKVERFFLKMSSQTSLQINDIAQLFPQIKMVFNTRHPVSSLKSSKRGLRKVPYALYFVLGIVWREMTAKGFALSYDKEKYRHLIKGYSKWIPNITKDEAGSMLYLKNILPYFENKEIYLRVILYENLSKEPEMELKKLFDIMEVSHEHIPAALSAMRRDSKKDTEFKKGQDMDLSPSLLAAYDSYLEKAGLPVRTGMSETEFMDLFRDSTKIVD